MYKLTTYKNETFIKTTLETIAYIAKANPKYTLKQFGSITTTTPSTIKNIYREVIKL